MYRFALTASGRANHAGAAARAPATAAVQPRATKTSPPI